MSSVDLLCDLVRIPTVNPPGDETEVAGRLEAFLSDAGVHTEILTSPAGRVNVVARVEGPRDTPALVLLSHTDVVPVEETSWTRDPFGAEIVDGFVWGRGTLDMKGIAVMHAMAAAELVRQGGSPTREVVVVAVSDEEAGGDEGARWLLEEHPDKLGFGDGRPPPEVVGEGAYGVSGMVSRPVVPIALGEKTAVWFDIVASGSPGHGAVPPREQAIVNLATILRELAGFGTARVHPVMGDQFAALAPAATGATAAVLRALATPASGTVARLMAAKLRKAGALGLLLSDSVTPTMMTAGYKVNVIPGEASASFDSRLLPDTDIGEFIASVDRKARRHQGRVANITQKGHGPVSGKGPLFDILVDASRQLAPDALPVVSLSPAITDTRFFRARGATGYGWTPLVLTPELLGTIHGHDERVEVARFEQAVAVMSDVVRRAAVESDST